MRNDILLKQNDVFANGKCCGSAFYISDENIKSRPTKGRLYRGSTQIQLCKKTQPFMTFSGVNRPQILDKTFPEEAHGCISLPTLLRISAPTAISVKCRLSTTSPVQRLCFITLYTFSAENATKIKNQIYILYTGVCK